MDSRLGSGMREIKPNDARETAHEIRSMAPALLAGNTPVDGGCTSVVVSLSCSVVFWLWQGGHVWVWAIAAAVLGLLAWPLSVSVKRRANQEARLALGDLAAPSRGWNAVERDAWAEVLAIADGYRTFFLH